MKNSDQNIEAATNAVSSSLARIAAISGKISQMKQLVEEVNGSPIEGTEGYNPVANHDFAVYAISKLSAEYARIAFMTADHDACQHQILSTIVTLSIPVGWAPTKEEIELLKDLYFELDENRSRTAKLFHRFHLENPSVDGIFPDVRWIDFAKQWLIESGPGQELARSKMRKEIRRTFPLRPVHLSLAIGRLQKMQEWLAEGNLNHGQYRIRRPVADRSDLPVV